jgi:hypothetical protein
LILTWILIRGKNIQGRNYSKSEIPSYVGYVYINKPRLLDSWFLVVAYIYMCHKIIFGLFEGMTKNSNEHNELDTNSRHMSRFSS